MLAGGLRANDRPGSSRRVWKERPWPAGERLWTRGVIISAITKNMPPKKCKISNFCRIFALSPSFLAAIVHTLKFSSISGVAESLTTFCQPDICKRSAVKTLRNLG